eukprot:UN24310
MLGSRTEFIVYIPNVPIWWPAFLTERDKWISCTGTNLSYFITSNETLLPKVSHYIVWIREWDYRVIQRIKKKFPSIIFVWFTFEGPHADRDQLSPEKMGLFDLGWSYKSTDDIWTPYKNPRLYHEALTAHPIVSAEEEFRSRNGKVFFT